MRVLVTGGSGRIGRYVVKDLLAAGHEVTSVDIAPPPSRLCRTLRVDLTEAGEVYQALATARAEAVIHMGAWADAGIVPDTRIYGDNVRGTYNVFQACADMGVQRVVSASSAQVYGLHHDPPIYVPLDEDHPLRPVNCYALAKIAGEMAAAYFVANRGLTILSFRFMAVRSPDEIDPEIARVVRNPGSDGRLLWTRTDARDAAMACRLAIEREGVPSGVYNIAGASIVLDRDTESLVREHFACTEVRASLCDRVSPMSCARAEAAFGYRPRYRWSELQRHPEEG